MLSLNDQRYAGLVSSNRNSAVNTKVLRMRTPCGARQGRVQANA